MCERARHISKASGLKRLCLLEGRGLRKTSEKKRSARRRLPPSHNAILTPSSSDESASPSPSAPSGPPTPAAFICSIILAKSIPEGGFARASVSSSAETSRSPRVRTTGTASAACASHHAGKVHSCEEARGGLAPRVVGITAPRARVLTSSAACAAHHASKVHACERALSAQERLSRKRKIGETHRPVRRLPFRAFHRLPFRPCRACHPHQSRPAKSARECLVSGGEGQMG